MRSCRSASRSVTTRPHTPSLSAPLTDNSPGNPPPQPAPAASASRSRPHARPPLLGLHLRNGQHDPANGHPDDPLSYNPPPNPKREHSWQRKRATTSFMLSAPARSASR